MLDVKHISEVAAQTKDPDRARAAVEALELAAVVRALKADIEVTRTPPAGLVETGLYLLGRWFTAS
jgi:hypothetical protein